MLHTTLLFLLLVTILCAQTPGSNPAGSAKSNYAGKQALQSQVFLEERAPFLRSAMVFKYHGKEYRVRRGVIIPLRYDRLWACFDPDTLRWVAVWQAPAGQPPITYDSMPAVSFPDKKIKASRPPALQGKLRIAFPGLSSEEIAKDGRLHQLLDGTSAVGPMDISKGRWMGIKVQGATPVVHYRLGTDIIHQAVTADANSTFILETQHGSEARSLITSYSNKGNVVDSKRGSQKLVSGRPADPIFPESYESISPKPMVEGVFSIRNINFPNSPRPIRATDIAFLSDGTSYLTTFDGDVWRVEDIHAHKSSWTRVATGLFEPLAIEATPEGGIYVLGRDQITQLIDQNKDGHIDEYRCASDAFLQTLHTRDFATSLAIAADGSFYIAKGGIMSMGTAHNKEMSTHRGAVVHLSPDGNVAKVLADGLRLPYVGWRSDGAVFASDQQGHYVPSTPIFYLPPGTGGYTFGFHHTNHQKKGRIDDAMLYFPYQHNRSAAAFHELPSSKSFKDFSPAFVQVSWNGRLFTIVTPKEGGGFAFRWPLQLDFPALNAASHPVTGELYTIGLGISGYKPTTPNLKGLAAVSQQSPFPTPEHVEVTTNSVVIKWNRSLGKDEAVTPMVPALRLYDIKRSKKYGSGHFLASGKPGEHRMQPVKVALSSDRRVQTFTFPVLFRADVFDLKLQISHGSLVSPLHIYTRPSHLPKASRKALDLLAPSKPVALAPGNVTRGKNHFKTYACIGCHSLGQEKLTGPPLKGVGKRLNAEQLRESILQPAKTITKGYPAAMPSFEGVMTPQELADLLAYLSTLKD